MLHHAMVSKVQPKQSFPITYLTCLFVQIMFALKACHNDTPCYLSLFTTLLGGNASILVTVTGSDTVKVTDITLFDNSGPTEVKGSLQV